MPLSLAAKIESLLFVATAPLSVRQLAKMTDANDEKVAEALAQLEERYREEASGLAVIHRGKEVLLSTKPEAGPLVSAFLKEQVGGELTRPQLETLTIIAYRGPVTKAELELIRGVNCSLITRNLLMRGLIEERQDPLMHTEIYEPSFEFLRYLGVQSVAELPQFEELHRHPDIEAVLGTEVKV
ncbi:MAG: SMC-Scp complex subunit ScpB [Patescibacteria group bacterium]